MNKEVIFESKIDGKFEFGYTPFTMITVMLFFIVIYLLKNDDWPFLKEYFVHFIFSFIVLEIFFIKIFSPRGKVIIKRNEGLVYVKLMENKKDFDLLIVTGFEYWWNYNFGNNTYSPEEWNGGGNSGLSGRGSENRLNLHVVLYGETGIVQELTENLEVWESFPIGWKYNLKKNDNNVRVFNLRVLVKSLLNQGVPVIRK